MRARSAIPGVHDTGASNSTALAALLESGGGERLDDDARSIDSRDSRDSHLTAGTARTDGYTHLGYAKQVAAAAAANQDEWETVSVQPCDARTAVWPAPPRSLSASAAAAGGRDHSAAPTGLLSTSSRTFELQRAHKAGRRSDPVSPSFRFERWRVASGS